MSDEEVRITIHRWFGEPKDFTLRYPLKPAEHEMLKGIYEEFTGRGGKDGQVIEDRMHPRLPRAVPGRPGGWLTLASIRDLNGGPNARRWRLAHWRGSGPGTHLVPARMSAAHLAGQEYISLRIDEHGSGYHGVPEKSVTKGTTISDVVAFDRNDNPAATFEIQYSGLVGGRAVRRDRAVERVGIPATWLGATESRPEWAEKVPWLGANRREAMSRGSWTVASGRRVFEMEPCRPGARRACEFGRNWCEDSHPLWVPRGGTVDAVVDGVIAGDLQRFDTGKSLIIATPADCQRWIDYYQTPKVARRVKDAKHRRAAAGSIAHNDAYPEARILASMLGVPTRQVPRCICCDQEKWSSATTGVCLDCDWGEVVEPSYDPPSMLAPTPVPDPVMGAAWALQAAQQAAINMTYAMSTYEELLQLWEMAKRSGSATPVLFKACQRRAAQITGGT